MILIYVVCKDAIEAKNIGKKILKKKLIACVNILDGMKSMYFWPPGGDKIEESSETILLVKTIKEKFSEINEEIHKMHSYELPCIFSIKVDEVDSKYQKWLSDQIK
ncbi:MAG: Divalent-cation tolerance protein CutA [Candidatus Anoxychlamydiales bacterium]|uniref:Divalent-cation tolerance protein CutA n=1 Tax=marine sediment metagenome TaxID=412755 RepID=A0A0F9JY04_9ZZZZ|nr:Divalent-cation tolerance protein CutA [Candidatus Anoxychlamydiales bacterium]